MEELYPDDWVHRFSPIDKQSGYGECDLVGFAMMLLRRRVFSLITRPFFTLNKRGERYAKSYATDEDFCDRLKAAGIKMIGCWDHTLPHRDVTQHNVRYIREKTSIKYHELTKRQYITGHKFEITDEMLREGLILDNSYHELDNKHIGEVCYIVGKGPSVEHLTADYFPTNGPIIALNETYEKVESLNLPNIVYSLQKDIGFGVPKRAVLLVHVWEDSSLFAKDYSPRYELDCEKLGLIRFTSFSATMAIRVAQIFGCRDLKFLCFDSCVLKDYRTRNFDKNITIPHNRTAYKNQYTIQESILFAADLRHEYITPGIKEGRVFDRSAEYDLTGYN
jgi:hypothetical protein